MQELYSIYHDCIPDFLSAGSDNRAMERLKDVGMNCGLQYTSFPLFKGIADYSRYQHSFGVGLIAYHFSLDPKQGIAGLYHDISSPVFAHVIDFMKGDHKNQEVTELDTKEFILRDLNIIRFLNDNGLTVDEVCDYHLYPICDNDSPKLSADRLEYSLGNMFNYGFCDLNTVKEIYDDLTVGKNEDGEDEIMFRHVSKAKLFFDLAMRCNRIYVCDNDRFAMEYLARLIRQQIVDGKLKEEDLYKSEASVIRKIDAEKWKQFCQLHVSQRSEDGWIIQAKKRYINPYVMGQSRLSQLDLEVCDEISRFVNISFDYPVIGI